MIAGLVEGGPDSPLGPVPEPEPWDAALIRGQDATSLVGIVRQGRLARDQRDGTRRVDLTWIDESALALIDRAVDQGRSLHLVYPAPAGQLSVLVAAQLLLHRFQLGRPSPSVGIVTADTTDAARAWEELRIATVGSREPLHEVFPCFRAGPDGESPLGRRQFRGLLIGRRCHDWRVDVLIEDHLAGRVTGDRRLPTIGLFADALDPTLERLSQQGELVWGWSQDDLVGGTATLECRAAGTVPFSVAHERLAQMAAGTDVTIEVSHHPEADASITRIRDDLRVLAELAGPAPRRHLATGLSVAWHHLSVLIALPCRPTVFDRFSGVPPWAARATASFEPEIATWADTLTGDCAEVASVLASDLGDLRAALERGNPVSDAVLEWATAHPQGLMVVRNQTAARALIAWLYEGAPSLPSPQVTSLTRIHREGTWDDVVAVGAPRRWDWHQLDSGIARDLRILVMGDDDARTCRWALEALRRARRRWSSAASRTPTWRALIGTDPPPAPTPRRESVGSTEIEVVAGPDFVAAPDPFDAFGSLLELQPLAVGEEGTLSVLARETESGSWQAQVPAIEVRTDKGTVLLEAGRPIEVREGTRIVDRIPESLEPGAVLLLGRSEGRIGLLEALEERLRVRRPDLVASRMLIDSYQRSVRAKFVQAGMTVADLHRSLTALGCDKTVQAVRGWLGETMAPRDLDDLLRLDQTLGLGLGQLRLQETFAAVQHRRGFRRAAGRALAEAARSSAVIADTHRIDPETGLSIADLRDAIVEAVVVSVHNCGRLVPVTELAHLEPE